MIASSYNPKNIPYYEIWDLKSKSLASAAYIDTIKSQNLNSGTSSTSSGYPKFNIPVSTEFARGKFDTCRMDAKKALKNNATKADNMAAVYFSRLANFESVLDQYLNQEGTASNFYAHVPGQSPPSKELQSVPFDSLSSSTTVSLQDVYESFNFLRTAKFNTSASLTNLEIAFALAAFTDRVTASVSDTPYRFPGGDWVTPSEYSNLFKLSRAFSPSFCKAMSIPCYGLVEVQRVVPKFPPEQNSQKSVSPKSSPRRSPRSPRSSGKDPIQVAVQVSEPSSSITTTTNHKLTPAYLSSLAEMFIFAFSHSSMREISTSIIESNMVTSIWIKGVLGVFKGSSVLLMRQCVNMLRNLFIGTLCYWSGNAASEGNLLQAHHPIITLLLAQFEHMCTYTFQHCQHWSPDWQHIIIDVISSFVRASDITMVALSGPLLNAINAVINGTKSSNVSPHVLIHALSIFGSEEYLVQRQRIIQRTSFMLNSHSNELQNAEYNATLPFPRFGVWSAYHIVDQVKPHFYCLPVYAAASKISTMWIYYSSYLSYSSTTWNSSSKTPEFTTNASSNPQIHFPMCSVKNIINYFTQRKLIEDGTNSNASLAIGAQNSISFTLLNTLCVLAARSALTYNSQVNQVCQGRLGISTDWDGAWPVLNKMLVKSLKAPNVDLNSGNWYTEFMRRIYHVISSFYPSLLGEHESTSGRQDVATAISSVITDQPNLFLDLDQLRTIIFLMLPIRDTSAHNLTQGFTLPSIDTNASLRVFKDSSRICASLNGAFSEAILPPSLLTPAATSALVTYISEYMETMKPPSPYGSQVDSRFIGALNFSDSSLATVESMLILLTCLINDAYDLLSPPVKASLPKIIGHFIKIIDSRYAFALIAPLVLTLFESMVTNTKTQSTAVSVILTLLPVDSLTSYSAELFTDITEHVSGNVGHVAKLVNVNHLAAMFGTALGVEDVEVSVANDDTSEDTVEHLSSSSSSTKKPAGQKPRRRRYSPQHLKASNAMLSLASTLISLPQSDDLRIAFSARPAILDAAISLVLADTALDSSIRNTVRSVLLALSSDKLTAQSVLSRICAALRGEFKDIEPSEDGILLMLSAIETSLSMPENIKFLFDLNILDIISTTCTHAVFPHLAAPRIQKVIDAVIEAEGSIEEEANGSTNGDSLETIQTQTQLDQTTTNETPTITTPADASKSDFKSDLSYMRWHRDHWGQVSTAITASWSNTLARPNSTIPVALRNRFEHSHPLREHEFPLSLVSVILRPLGTTTNSYTTPYTPLMDSSGSSSSSSAGFCRGGYMEVQMKLKRPASISSFQFSVSNGITVFSGGSSFTRMLPLGYGESSVRSIQTIPIKPTVCSHVSFKFFAKNLTTSSLTVYFLRFSGKFTGLLSSVDLLDNKQGVSVPTGTLTPERTTSPLSSPRRLSNGSTKSPIVDQTAPKKSFSLATAFETLGPALLSLLKKILISAPKDQKNNLWTPEFSRALHTLTCSESKQISTLADEILYSLVTSNDTWSSNLAYTFINPKTLNPPNFARIGDPPIQNDNKLLEILLTGSRTNSEFLILSLSQSPDLCSIFASKASTNSEFVALATILERATCGTENSTPPFDVTELSSKLSTLVKLNTAPSNFLVNALLRSNPHLIFDVAEILNLPNSSSTFSTFISQDYNSSSSVPEWKGVMSHFTAYLNDPRVILLAWNLPVFSNFLSSLIHTIQLAKTMLTTSFISEEIALPIADYTLVFVPMIKYSPRLATHETVGPEPTEPSTSGSSAAVGDGDDVTQEQQPSLNSQDPNIPLTALVESDTLSRLAKIFDITSMRHNLLPSVAACIFDRFYSLDQQIANRPDLAFHSAYDSFMTNFTKIWLTLVENACSGGDEFAHQNKNFVAKLLIKQVQLAVEKQSELTSVATAREKMARSAPGIPLIIKLQLDDLSIITGTGNEWISIPIGRKFTAFSIDSQDLSPTEFSYNANFSLRGTSRWFKLGQMCCWDDNYIRGITLRAGSNYLLDTSIKYVDNAKVFSSTRSGTLCGKSFGSPTISQIRFRIQSKSQQKPPSDNQTISSDWLSSITVGTFLDVRDRSQKWCIARVLKKTDSSISVTYWGWATKYNETISINSNRIAPLYNVTKGKETRSLRCSENPNAPENTPAPPAYKPQTTSGSGGNIPATMSANDLSKLSEEEQLKYALQLSSQTKQSSSPKAKSTDIDPDLALALKISMQLGDTKGGKGKNAATLSLDSTSSSDSIEGGSSILGNLFSDSSKSSPDSSQKSSAKTSWFGRARSKITNVLSGSSSSKSAQTSIRTGKINGIGPLFVSIFKLLLPREPSRLISIHPHVPVPDFRRIGLSASSYSLPSASRKSLSASPSAPRPIVSLDATGVPSHPSINCEAWAPEKVAAVLKPVLRYAKRNMNNLSLNNSSDTSNAVISSRNDRYTLCNPFNFMDGSAESVWTGQIPGLSGKNRVITEELKKVAPLRALNDHISLPDYHHVATYNVDEWKTVSTTCPTGPIDTFTGKIWPQLINDAPLYPIWLVTTCHNETIAFFYPGIMAKNSTSARVFGTFAINLDSGCIFRPIERTSSTNCSYSFSYNRISYLRFGSGYDAYLYFQTPYNSKSTVSSYRSVNGWHSRLFDIGNFTIRSVSVFGMNKPEGFNLAQAFGCLSGNQSSYYSTSSSSSASSASVSSAIPKALSPFKSIAKTFGILTASNSIQHAFARIDSIYHVESKQSVSAVINAYFGHEFDGSIFIDGKLVDPSIPIGFIQPNSGDVIDIHIEPATSRNKKGKYNFKNTFENVADLAAEFDTLGGAKKLMPLVAELIKNPRDADTIQQLNRYISISGFGIAMIRDTGSWNLVWRNALFDSKKTGIILKAPSEFPSEFPSMGNISWKTPSPHTLNPGISLPYLFSKPQVASTLSAASVLGSVSSSEHPVQNIERILPIIQTLLATPNVTIRQQVWKSHVVDDALKLLGKLEHEESREEKRKAKALKAKQKSPKSPAKKVVYDSDEGKYWSKGTGFGTGSSSSKWSTAEITARASRKQWRIFNSLSLLSTALSPLNAVWSDTELFDMLEKSCIVPVLEQYLRNDSIMSMAKEAELYHTILDICCHLARDAHFFRLLLPLEDQTKSLSELINPLHSAASVFIKSTGAARAGVFGASSSSGTGKANLTSELLEKTSDDDLLLAKKIKRVCKLIHKATKAFAQKGQSITTTKIDPNETLGAKFIRIMKPTLFGLSTSQVNGAWDHHYSSQISGETYGANHSKMLRVSQEISSLANALPINIGATIWVRVDPKRMDVLRIIMSAPEGTPYAHGLFEFHAYLPSNYPGSPPHVNLETTGNGAVRFGPNLYASGKVCLSILNTWRGRPEEEWQPKQSTFLQVLVSVQSVLLGVSEPYYNEPGWERQKGTPDGISKSNAYSAQRVVNSLNLAILDMIRNPIRGFENETLAYFYLKKDIIIKEYKRWLTVLQEWKSSYASQLSGLIPKLENALNGIASPKLLDPNFVYSQDSGSDLDTSDEDEGSEGDGEESEPDSDQFEEESSESEEESETESDNE